MNTTVTSSSVAMVIVYITQIQKFYRSLSWYPPGTRKAHTVDVNNMGKMLFTTQPLVYKNASL